MTPNKFAGVVVVASTLHGLIQSIPEGVRAFLSSMGVVLGVLAVEWVRLHAARLSVKREHIEKRQSSEEPRDSSPGFISRDALVGTALFAIAVVAIAALSCCQHSLPIRVTHNLPPTLVLSIEHADAGRD